MNNGEDAGQLLLAGCQQLNWHPNDQTIQQLLNFVSLLQRWNTVINLTAITSKEKIISHHLLDSLAIADFLSGDTVLDLGSGAGLPGIPLALYYPEKQFTLLDSNKKKIHFITQAKIELGLDNVEVVWQRMENYFPINCFATVVSRATTSLAQLLQYQHLFCTNQGQLLVMKGVYPTQELQQLPSNGYLIKVSQLAIPYLNAKRHLVAISLA